MVSFHRKMKRKRESSIYPDVNDPKYNKKQRVGDKLITYTQGFCSILTRNFTKGNLVDVIKELKKEFELRYKAKFEFEPEPICEGGIRWKYWNGKKDREYKSLRVIGLYGGPKNQHNWPIINEDSLKEWKGSNDVLFYKTWVKGKRKYDHRFHTFVKAFRGAPIWTREEILIFKDIFTKYGFKPVRFPYLKDFPRETKEITMRYQ